MSNFQSKNAKLEIGKVDDGPYMYLINKITNSLLMLRMNEKDKSIAVNAQINGAWGSEKLLATKNDLGVTEFNGGKPIVIDATLSGIGKWINSQGFTGTWRSVRCNPNNQGYFGSSAFCILWNCTSASYGWCILMSDNSKMVVFGRNTDGWHWYAPSLSEVS